MQYMCMHLLNKMNEKYSCYSKLAFYVTKN